MFLKNRVDPVGGDDDVGLDDFAVGELETGPVFVLAEIDALVSGVNGA